MMKFNKLFLFLMLIIGFTHSHANVGVGNVPTYRDSIVKLWKNCYNFFHPNPLYVMLDKEFYTGKITQHREICDRVQELDDEIGCEVGPAIGKFRDSFTFAEKVQHLRKIKRLLHCEFIYLDYLRYILPLFNYV